MYIIATNHRGKKEVHIDSIHSVYASDDDVYVVINDNELKVQEKLYDFETFPSFVRINKSEVVNITSIKDVKPLFNSKLKLELLNGEVLYVNRTYLKSFKNYLTGGVN